MPSSLIEHCPLMNVGEIAGCSGKVTWIWESDYITFCLCESPILEPEVVPKSYMLSLPSWKRPQPALGRSRTAAGGWGWGWGLVEHHSCRYKTRVKKWRRPNRGRC
ncbi:hypothetical protein PoB_004431900 [Plakobranchus ocellatus]|uniref:Uncharacterized protein n=1 Tax=Plakobranchus ocellatus TaxID=259542 RepID=A0AAV4BG27_9GAST|nr:hypothetical protein PoB_004431900 [Plakobranchus ocellatus]